MTNGTIVYAGTVLDSDDGPGSVVKLLDSKRTRLAASLSATVYALALDGTNIYAGGDFKGNSTFATTNIAKWDGDQWLPLGGGLPGIVRALAVKDGSLFAGYTVTNDTTATGVVSRWDGTNWIDLGADLRTVNKAISAVRALQFVGDRLYVGGNFISAGGVAATNIAEFSSGRWKALTMGTNNGVTRGSSLPPEVHALAATPNGELIVGGTFTNAGGIFASMVAKWTGSEWQALGLGLSRPSVGSVDALYCQGNDVYAGGSFIYADGMLMPGTQRGFARWDGTNWGPVFSALTSEPVSAITGDGTNIFAATPLVSPVVSGSPPPTGIIKVNSANWSILGGGISQSYGAIKTITTNSTNIQINGLPVSGTQTVLEWNNSLWVADGAGVVGSIESLAHAQGITYAAGPFTAIVGDGEAHGVAGLDGTNWFSIGEGLPSDGLVVALHGTNLFAGHQSGIRQWNGSAWTDVGNGLPGEVRAIAFDGDRIYAGGAFATNSPEALTNVAQFSGDTWKPLGLGVNGRVRGLAVVDHKLYAGGDFTEADGKTANHIAVWDGAYWTELGGGISNGIYGATVNAIQPDTVGGLFVAGDFRNAGNQSANFIAHWNGDQWEQLGSGLNGVALGLTINGEDLFVVGPFQQAGDHPSNQIARWRMSGITLSALATGDNGTVSLEAHGIISKEFVLQRSSDLRSWQNVSTNTLTPPRLSLNAMPDGAAAFYRVVTN